MSKSWWDVTGVELRAPMAVLMLGVLWGALNQLLLPLLRAADVALPFDWWMYITWPLALLAVLLAFARNRSAVAWGGLGALFAAGVVVGWFGLYAALLELGLTPQGVQMHSGVELIGSWLRSTIELTLRPWLIAAIAGGLLLGAATGFARRLLPAAR